MTEAGTANGAAAAKLPKVSGTPVIPTEEQNAKAKDYLAKNWANAVG